MTPLIRTKTGIVIDGKRVNSAPIRRPREISSSPFPAPVSAPDGAVPRAHPLLVLVPHAPIPRAPRPATNQPRVHCSAAKRTFSFFQMPPAYMPAAA